VGRLPIRELVEPLQGKSYALNRAVSEAKGEYIIWTDDDALVEPQWLEAYTVGFARWPGAAMFGGPIDPWFEGLPPAWLLKVWDRVGGPFAVLDVGDTPVPMTHATVPFGVNMAIRLTEQAAHPYDPALGPSGHRMIKGGEDTGLIRRLLDDGHTGWMLPEARVRHFVPSIRQTEAYIRRWHSGYGEYLARSPGPAGRTLFGRPLWLWRRAIQAEVLYRLRRLTSDPTVWIEDLKTASESWGALRGSR
jgi:glycosyltransferase involved in cell wall biosynthesis